MPCSGLRWSTRCLTVTNQRQATRLYGLSVTVYTGALGIFFFRLPLTFFCYMRCPQSEFYLCSNTAQKNQSFATMGLITQAYNLPTRCFQIMLDLQASFHVSQGEHSGERWDTNEPVWCCCLLAAQIKGIGFEQGTWGGKLGRVTFAKERSSCAVCRSCLAVVIGVVCLFCWVVKVCATEQW